MFSFEVELQLDVSTQPSLSSTVLDGEVRLPFSTNEQLRMDLTELRFGYKIFHAGGGQAAVDQNIKQIEMRFDTPYPFRMQLPDWVAQEDSFIVLIDFMGADGIWHRDQGGIAQAFLVEKTALEVHIARLDEAYIEKGAPSGEEPHKFASDITMFLETKLEKGSAHLRSSIIAGAECLMKKFGPVVAIEFAYEMILGRAADPEGRSSKAQAITTRHQTVENICLQMLESDEFLQRKVAFIRDPAVAMLSWAGLDD